MSDLTEKQRELADALFTSEVDGKITRRHDNPDGTYSFEAIERKVHIVEFPSHPGEFALKVHEKDPSAPLSPVYINLRHLPDNLLQLVVKVMNEVKMEETPKFVTGIPRAGIPLAIAYSQISGIPFVDIFVKTGTLTDRKIEPKPDFPQKQDESLIIVDDLISQGNSKLEAIEAARKLGFKVLGISILFDREQGGSKQLRDLGYKVHTALTLSQMLDYYLETGKITQERYNQIQNYLKPKD